MVAIVRFFNQPVVKESIKGVLGGITCALGILEIYEDGKECLIDLRSRCNGVIVPHPWHCSAWKILVVVSKISLIASALSTRPSVLVFSWVATRIFTDAQLERFFGRNVNFATNPYHPKHVTSIVGFLLGLPATLKSLYDAMMWIRSKCSSSVIVARANADAAAPAWRWMTPVRIQLAATWNTLSSRVMLHSLNRFSSYLLAK